MRLPIFSIVVLSGLLVLTGAGRAHAASLAETEHVKVQLLADKAAIAPGDTVTLALEETIIPEWHTYWRNPGDSGIAPTVTWTLPAGFTAGEILWPAPTRLAYGPLVNFGYSDHTVLLTQIVVPATAVPGTDATLTAAFSWLVCQESCIPESAKLDVTVPVAAAGMIDASQSAFFATARGALPQPAPYTADIAIDTKVMTLNVKSSIPRDAFFFPYRSGLMDDAAPQVLHATNEGYTLALARGELHQPFQTLEGVLEVAEAGTTQPRALTLSAPVTMAAPLPPAVPRSTLTIAGAMVLAVLGGLLLNLMPCVFPVLSLKVLALAAHREQSRAVTVRAGLSYAAGVLCAFCLVAGLLLGFRAAGGTIGWGFQLQSPPFVLCLAWLLFILGLSLSGLFSVAGSFIGLGSRLAGRGGDAGSFFTGALAALVATPCSAPFMGTAVGFAVSQPWPIAIAIIECLGLGLALPFLLISCFPTLARLLPRPGAWMERFKQFLAFPLYGSAAWLVWVLSLQSGANGVLIALGGALLLSFAIWIGNTAGHAARPWKWVARIVATLAVLSAITGAASPSLRPATPASGGNAFIPAGWEPYSDTRLRALQQAGTPVFVDMSAAWCITCMMNERVALGPETAEILHHRGIVLMKGDWTNQDPAITAMLAAFGRNGVPLYVYYPGPGKAPVVLPQLLTPHTVLTATDPG